MHFCNAAVQQQLFCIAQWATIFFLKLRRFLTLIKRMTVMFLSQIVRFLRQWRSYNKSLRELSQLGDHELSDMGISRSDIPRVAWDSSSC
jgi:uncharacterized protein YjiS (DUF1127 family)